jgi:hypothetical protein
MEKYDGQIVFASDDMIEKNDMRFFYDSDNEFVDICPFIGQSEEKLQENKKNLEILNLLLRGRLRMSLVLNSKGGNGDIMEVILSIISLIKEHGGTVDAYISREAISAAAMLVLEADQVHALDLSHFMWHLPIIDPDSTEEYNGRDFESLSREDVLKLRGMIEGDMEWTHSLMVAKMLRKCTEDTYWDFFKLLYKLRQRDHDDPIYRFTGRFLAEYGIVDKIHDTPKSLKAEFIKNTGITLLPQMYASEFEKKIMRILDGTEHNTRKR